MKHGIIGENCDITQYDVIVVGGGMAGLTAAAYATEAGHKVLLLEQNSSVGGLVGSFSCEGFTFDSGIRALENAGTLIPMLRRLGLDAELIKSEIYIKIKDKTVRISGEDSLLQYEKMLSSLFSRNRREINRIMQKIKRTVDDMDVLYGAENPLFLPLPQNLIEAKKMLLWLTKYLYTVARINLSKKPIYECLSEFTGNKSLIDMIAQHFFTGSPTFFALGYFWLYRDYYYPKNSVGSVPQMLKEYIEKNDNRVKCNAKVTAVDVKKRLVAVSDHRYKYEKLIWCCNKKSLWNSAFPPSPKASRHSLCHGSDSVLMIYIAVSLPPQEIAKKCGSHMFSPRQ